ncbi:hypothetical protein GCM10010260_64760 [Streptomyces filipinensis]|uniref:Uncharacterized protein n=1 Tax=Streptomyces filipinensis TaxID=66887 RepID=A0A918MEL4_9ACTN|nr:hypothetical protein GCM10010260_64760 [Streptomyces filipinensis]
MTPAGRGRPERHPVCTRSGNGPGPDRGPHSYGGCGPHPCPAVRRPQPGPRCGWAYEVAAQERQSGVFFDTVAVCWVTGCTQVGMVAGFRSLEEAGGRRRRVIGIDASAEPAAT